MIGFAPSATCGKLKRMPDGGKTLETLSVSEKAGVLPWGTRLKLSALSVLIVGVFVGTAHFLINELIRADAFNFRPAAFGYTLLFCTLICYQGWIFSIPLVLHATPVSRRGFWLCLLAGSAIGPALVTVMVGITFLTNQLLPPAKHSGAFPFPFSYCYSFVASGLSSLICLQLFRRRMARI